MVRKAPETTRSSTSHQGRMTSVMTAARSTGPKVLRIGLVRDGQIVEERIITEHADVTAGPSENSTFVLPVRLLGKGHALFSRSGRDHFLLFHDGMTGRVALPADALARDGSSSDVAPGGVSDLEELKHRASRDPDGWYRLALTDDSRGKLDIGGTILLFQFVTPPPSVRRPQLPPAALRSGVDIDWRTTIIAAVAFLLHFAAVGAMYSDWLDPPVDDDLTLAGLVETLARLPPPPPPEEKPAIEEKKADDKPTREVAKTQPKAQPKSTPTSGKLSAEKVAQLSRDMSSLKMLALASVAGLGDATSITLRSGDLPTGLLDTDAAADRGAGFGSALGLSGGGGLVTPGAAGNLRSLADTSAGPSGSAVTKTASGPKASVQVTSRVKAGSVSDTAQAVGSMGPGFRRCYRRAVEQAPDQAGAITLTLRIGPGGEVSSVAAAVSGNLSSAVVECVKGVARGGQFNPPDGGSAVIDVPLSFVQQ